MLIIINTFTRPAPSEGEGGLLNWQRVGRRKLQLNSKQRYDENMIESRVFRYHCPAKVGPEGIAGLDMVLVVKKINFRVTK